MERRTVSSVVRRLAVALSLLGVPEIIHAEWSAIVGSRFLYTDNVFELSAARRLSLGEDPSQPTIVPIEKPSDVVWTPSIDVRRTSSSALGRTELSVKAHGFIYTDHSIFNHGNYRIQLKQDLSPDTSFLLRYRYVPNLFLGPNTERRTGNRLQEEERVTSHIWRVQLERRLADAWTVTLVGRYGLRLFNDVFAERDTRFWTSGPQVEFAATSWATITLTYLYERGLADGRHEPQFNDDVSYRQHFSSLGATFQLSRRLFLDLAYAFRRKEFTSELPGDSNRGVVDTTHQGTTEFQYVLTDAARLTLGFQRSQRSSNSAARDFFNTNASLGLEYRF